MQIQTAELARQKEVYIPHSDGTPAYHAFFQYKGVTRFGEIQVVNDDHLIMYQIERDGLADTGSRRFNFDKIESEIELLPIV
jgi:hypothetical protein